MGVGCNLTSQERDEKKKTSTWLKEPINFFYKMLIFRATANHVVLHCSIYARVMSQMFLFYVIFLWGCFGFSWGCWSTC